MNVEMSSEQVERHIQGLGEELERLFFHLKFLEVRERPPEEKMNYTVANIKVLVKKMEDMFEKIDVQEVEA